MARRSRSRLTTDYADCTGTLTHRRAGPLRNLDFLRLTAFSLATHVDLVRFPLILDLREGPRERRVPV